MEITVEQLNQLINGQVEGDKNAVIEGFSPIEEAGKGSITFLSNPKYAQFLYDTEASAVLVSKDFKPEKSVNGTTLIYVEDVYSTLSLLMEKFQTNGKNKEGIASSTHIEDSAEYGKEVFIGAFSYVGKHVKIGDRVKIYPNVIINDNTKIGDDTVIYSTAQIYEDTEIGENCIIHAGSVIGSDGFGFAPQKNGEYKKMPQTGNVLIEDHVEIGANTTIDRATMRSTILRKGVKLDNLIQVAHNVEIGENTAIASQTGISGSTKIGKNCVIGGQVGITGHISIADGSQIGAQSGVSNSIKEKNQKWFGSPVAPFKEAIKASILFKKLPDIYERLKQLETSLKRSKAKGNTHENEAINNK